MLYATAADFIAAFGEPEALMLTQLDDPMATVIDESVLTVALEDASEEANGYLQVRYAIPVTPTNTLRRKVLDLARYSLSKYDPPELVKQNYQYAIGWLKSVAAGKVALGLEAESGDPVTTNSGALISESSSRVSWDLGGF